MNWDEARKRLHDELKLYRVMEHKDAGWQVLVVARTAKAAKAHGWEAIQGYGTDAEYLDVRVKLVRNIAIPDTIYEPLVMDGCREWNCDAWGLSEVCGDKHCTLYEAKRQAHEEHAYD